MMRRLLDGKSGRSNSGSLEVPDATCLAPLSRLALSSQPATSFHAIRSMSSASAARFTTVWTESVCCSVSSAIAASPSTCTYRMAAWHSGGEYRQRDMGERRR
jgi:hypothetical protein